MAAAAATKISYERLPESETYGRSLSTPYRLGVFAVGRSAPEIITSPEANQARTEFYTSVEEGFGTDIELGGGLEVRDFDHRPIIGGRVMAKDLKTSVSEMTECGVACAVETASTDKRFLPQLTRSRYDHKNAQIVDKMARGETSYNTRIVVSPFPEEAAAQTGDEYWRDIGYVPHLRRGFVQLYHANGAELIAGSLSFDGSNKARLREVFLRRGIKIPESETTDSWLKYAITETLTEDEAKSLALEIANALGDPRYKKNTNTVQVTSEHRTVMNTVFEESYVPACESLARGHQTPGVRQLIFQLADKAHHFNNRYATALYEMRANGHEFTDDNMIVVHELLVYSTIEMMRALHLSDASLFYGEAGTNWTAEFDLRSLQTLESELFQNALSSFAAEGAKNNRVYSACGLSIALGEAARSADNPQAVFGGLTSGEDRFGPLRFQCTLGHWNHRPYNKLLDKCQHIGCKGKVKC